MTYEHSFKFLKPTPGLVPLSDGVNWELDGHLTAHLPDGRIVGPRKKFHTDLASVPPLGVVGGIVMLLGWLLSQLTGWADAIVLTGFFICAASAWIKAFGKFTLSAVFHDWMWRTQSFSFVVSNWLFLKAMKSEGTAAWIRFLMWFNVMLFGYGIYHGYKRHFRNAKKLAHVTPHQHGHGGAGEVHHD